MSNSNKLLAFLGSVVLRQSEEEALEECLLVMKPCDPAAGEEEDECLDEEVSLCFSNATFIQHAHIHTYTRIHVR